MTFREMWFVLIGRPERAVEVANGESPAAEARDPRIATLDWATTDSAQTLKERARRAAAQAR